VDDEDDSTDTLVTCAANCPPEAALTVTVARCPTFTLPMSDSLSETCVV
jgi:hypothetical protein